MVLWFLFIFSENLDFKTFKRIEIPYVVGGHCEGSLRSSKLQILRLNANAQMLLISVM